MSILVVGALHHDVIVETPALPRIDETLPGESVRYAFGGKGGNQAVQAGRLGRHLDISVAMAGCIGRDAPGDLMLETLNDAGVDTAQVQRVDEPTGMSVALSLPDGGYGAVIVSAANQLINHNQVKFPPDIRWLVLQNEISEAANSAIAKRIKDAGAKVLLNAAPAKTMSDALMATVDLLVVNQVEAADLLSQAPQALRPHHAAEQLRMQFACDVIITLGGEGLVIATAKQTEHSTSHQVDVISTHGAGDAFIGALAVKLAGGAVLPDAARFASAAAALHVSAPVDDRAQISVEAIEALAQTASR